MTMRLQDPTGPELLEAVPTLSRTPAVSGRPWLALRALGALALLATGAVHLQQFDYVYSGIPTIGTLFVLNFAGATALALVLLGPVERVGGRYGRAVLNLAAVAGIALAATSLVFLYVSERTPLFGFEEPGFDPSAIAAARGAEIATVVFLGAFLVGRAWLKRPMPRW